MAILYTPKSLGLYIHIPFCRSKCQYCDFYSLGGGKDKKLIDRYLQALANHIKEFAAQAPEHVVDTVYFGGGTPTFFGADNLRQIFMEIQRHFKLSKKAEITFEANPDSVNDQLLKRLRRVGFNRMSLGIQCDNDDILKKLGRPHNYEQAALAFRKARRHGFKNISMDLMYGLPGQTLDQWKDTLNHVLELKPDHMSCYALKVEEGTPLWDYKDCCNLPDDDTQADMYLAAVEILKKAGLEQYEISNFAKPGFESRHNLKYWLGDEYIGFGPAAASDFAGKRFTNNADIHNYIRGLIQQDVSILAECDPLPLRDRAGEYLMLRMRTVVGIQSDEYERTFLMPFRPLQNVIDKYSDDGLFVRKDGRWLFTPKGFLLSNQLIGELLEAQEQSVPLGKRQN